MAVYTKSRSDGYTKVGRGSFQLQSKNKDIKLGVIYSRRTPDKNAIPELVIESVFGHKLVYGNKYCFVKVFSKTPVMFGAVAV